jgi:uncharacterized protein (DUF488 family)
MPTETLISLGYEGRSVAEVLELLSKQSVSVLVDVRLTPLSRKPGMSKRKLAAALHAAGIDYVHLPQLGNPKDNRDPFRMGDPRSRTRFRAQLDHDGPSEALHQIAELLDSGTVAVLCFERDHASCHRHIVAEAVREANPSVELVAV